MLPEIWSVTDRILSFWVIFAFLAHKQTQKWQSYDVWFLKYGAQRIEFFVIPGHFLPFHPTNNPENQNFEKLKKKMPGNIIILYMSTINNNHIMYGSWDM